MTTIESLSDIYTAARTQRNFDYIYYLDSSRRKCKNSFRALNHGLTIQDFIEFAKDEQEIMQFLPDERDIVNVPREYLIYVIYSVDGDQFGQWVDEIVLQRNKQIKLKNDQYIQLDPKIVKIFAQATHSSRK